MSDITVERLNKGIREEVTHSFFIVKGEVSLVRKLERRPSQKRDSTSSHSSHKEDENPIKQKWHLELNDFNEDIELTATKDTIAVYFGRATTVDSKEKYKQSTLFKNSFLIMNKAKQVEANFEDIDRQSVRVSFNNNRPTTRVNNQS